MISRPMVAAVACATAVALGALPGRTPAQVPTAAPAPRRVISLIPSITDLIVAMGAGDRLVARTAFDQNPAVANLPSVGGTTDPSLEHMVALHPDLVFTWREASAPQVESQLARAGIHSEVMGTETFAELHATLGRLGQVFHLERQADSVRRAIDDTLAAVRASTAGRPPVRVLYLLDTNPPFTTGPGTFIDELITAAGGRNIFGDVGVNWPTVSIEAVLQRNPDVIVWPRPRVLPDAAKALGRLPGWSELPAVRSGRVLVVDRDLFNRPGPRIGGAARSLANGFLRLDCLASLLTGSGRADVR